MTDTTYNVELTDVDSEGNIRRMHPENTADCVTVGAVTAGSLTLPGNSASETLDVTLANIKKFLTNLLTVSEKSRGVVSDYTSESSDDIATISAVNTVYKNDINSTSIETIKRAPINHASTATTYGGGTGSNYGHVKLSDTYDSSVTGANAAGSVAASQNALYNAFNSLNSSKAPTSHASTDTTYGAGNASNYGHVKLSDTYTSKQDGGNAAGGVAASQNALYAAYNALSTTINDSSTGLASKAPKNHASTETTYGAGTGSNFGHVKLSDTYDSAVSGANAAGSVGSSQNALNAAYAALVAVDNTKLGSSHASLQGNGSTMGHVMLTDSYSDTTAASGGKAPSALALANAVSALSNSINSLQNSVNALNSKTSVVISPNAPGDANSLWVY